MKPIFIFLLFLSIQTVFGKLYTKCELARELVDFHGSTVENAKKFLCISEFSAEFNTNYSGENTFGIFNIGREACGVEVPSGSCNILCKSLLDDDIRNDFICALQTKIKDENDCDNDIDIDDCELVSAAIDDDSDNEASNETFDENEKPTSLENAYEIVKQEEEGDEEEEQTKSENDEPTIPEIEIEQVSVMTQKTETRVDMIRELVQRNRKLNARFIFLFV